MAKRTPLYDIHIKYGGKMTEFAGFELPVQYQKGILHEHAAVRNACGLFDVSHMGEILIEAGNASAALRYLVTNNVADMDINRCRYALMCYPDGGIIDDLLIYKFSAEKFLLIVNASNTQKDFDWIVNNLPDGATAVNVSDMYAQIALQGRYSGQVLAKLTDTGKIPDKIYRFADNVTVAGIKCLVSTTGYTGESGYELYCATADASALYEALYEAGKEFGIEPAGLGARDTLRFESSMPLYGHELSKDTLATETGLNPFIKTDEDFIGREALANKPPMYKRIGLRLVDKGIAREGCAVISDNGLEIGYVTSGGMCPALNGAYAMARVEINFAQDKAVIDVRGRKLLAETVQMPFYKRKI